MARRTSGMRSSSGSVQRGREHVEREAGVARVQQLEQRLRQHRVADPRRTHNQDLA